MSIDTEILATVTGRLQRMLSRHSEYSRAERDLASAILATIDRMRLEHELAVERKIHGAAA